MHGRMDNVKTVYPPQTKFAGGIITTYITPIILTRHIQNLIREKLSKFLQLSFCQKLFFLSQLLHAYVQCVYIVKAKYQIVPSKAVVGVDLPMKAPLMHIQKQYYGKIV